MVPREGPSSNSDGDLVAEWKRNNKEFQNPQEAASFPELSDEFFDTLAQWNTYLEEHVPEAAQILRADEEVQP